MTTKLYLDARHKEHLAERLQEEGITPVDVDTVEVVLTQGGGGYDYDNPEHLVLKVGDRFYHSRGAMEDPRDYGEEGEPFYSWYSFEEVEEYNVEEIVHTVISPDSVSPSEELLGNVIAGMGLAPYELSDWMTDNFWHGKSSVVVQHEGETFVITPLPERVEGTAHFGYNHGANFQKIIEVGGKFFLLVFTFNSWVGVSWYPDGAIKEASVVKEQGKTWRRV